MNHTTEWKPFSWRLVLGVFVSWCWSLMVCCIAYRIDPFSKDTIQLLVWLYGMSLPAGIAITHAIRYTHHDIDNS